MEINVCAWVLWVAKGARAVAEFTRGIRLVFTFRHNVCPVGAGGMLVFWCSRIEGSAL